MKPIYTNPETDFFSGLIELQYGMNVEGKLRKIAADVPWAKGWPDEPVAFWNAEAFMWSCKVERGVREMIENEMAFLASGRNLDLGCGSYSYLPSVGMDFSPQMLKFNEQCREKVLGSVEEELPFPSRSFDSVTAVFLLNYVQHCRQLLSEIRRVLKARGIFMAVLPAKGVTDWPARQEVHHYSRTKWSSLLRQGGFRVHSYEQGNVLFFRCRK